MQSWGSQVKVLILICMFTCFMSLERLLVAKEDVVTGQENLLLVPEHVFTIKHINRTEGNWFRTCSKATT